MTLDDAALARVALAVAAASGVLLALLISVHISVISRMANEQKDSLGQLRTNGDRLHELLIRETYLTQLYFQFIGIKFQQYSDFAGLVIRLSHAHSNQDAPNYFDWRIQTNIFRIGVTKSRNQFPKQGEALHRYDLEFVDSFWRLDTAIQFNELPAELNRISKLVNLATRIAGGLLVLSLAVGIISVTTSRFGVSDDWNLLIASIFLLGAFTLVIVAERITRKLGVSQQDVIEDLLRRRGYEPVATARLKRLMTKIRDSLLRVTQSIFLIGG